MFKAIFSTLAAILVLVGASTLPASAQERAATNDADDMAIPRYEARLGRARPVIAVVGFNAATEVTDYVVPYGVLAESKMADVVALSTTEGPIQMKPALRFKAQATINVFDLSYPDGADYVVVPNVYEGENDPALLEWLRSQAAKGATIVGICDGVPTLANAGLLQGRRATTHRRTIDRLAGKHPGTQWLKNRRYVADGKIITTSGVSASIPISMALIEAIAGRAHALEVGQRLGVTEWSATHNSEQFSLTSKHLLTVLSNKAMFWRHEALGVEARPDIDEIRVALVADAYGRTRRTEALSVAASNQPVVTRRGLTLLPDRVAGRNDAPRILVPGYEELPPVHALDASLESIASSYGKPTAAFVAFTMEYAWSNER
jgi:putative intracellular protease/amidase